MTTTIATPLIACLESFLSPSQPVAPPNPNLPNLSILPPSTIAKLKNLGHPRIRDMRALGHSTQILSHIPIAATPQTCVKLNDALEAGTRLQSAKMGALGLLPGGRADGRDAARELQRCVTKLRFVGGVVAMGSGLEEKGFDEVWGMAQRYSVPVMLREAWPSGVEIADYTQDLPESTVAPLATHFHITHVTSPMPVLRLYLNGIFDRFPSLRLIIAHPGSLPSLLPRIDTVLESIPEANKPKRSFLDVWQHNVYLTTADIFDLSSLRTMLEQIPMDRVLYASNYPIEERGRELIMELKESKFLSENEWERLAWRNAEELFKLSSPDPGPYTVNTKTVTKPGQHVLIA